MTSQLLVLTRFWTHFGGEEMTERVYVSPHHIAAIEPSGECSNIYLSAGGYLNVEQSPDEVFALWQKALQSD